MLQSIKPIPVITFPLWSMKHSFSLLFIIFVLSFVPPSIRPLKQPFSIHFISSPLPLIHLAIRPLVHSISLNKVILKLSFIHVSITSNKLPLSTL
mmetsp:Transcript_799/g.104  ORF Transcript_799/g.104 Transcript_799/m.104 type:complete len:95 (+) Transcript_799:80-364(+)